MMIELEWRRWLERLYNLRRDKRGSHERPHKPVLLLAIIDLLDRKQIAGNQVPISDELVTTFKRLFELVRQPTDQPTIQNPLFHLSSDGFWTLEPRASGEVIYRVGEASGSPSLGELRRRVAFGRFDPGLWQLLCDQDARLEVRESLIDRYFPDKRASLAPLTATEAAASGVLREEAQRGRDAAFRKTILEIYDYRCAACGIRVRIESDVSLVEAAHLIPFNVSRNDRPDNGLALCPNHHWAMDRFLITPCPDDRHKAGIWKVSSRLDDRLEGQKDLLGLLNRPVIPPGEEKFLPSRESLEWRHTHLSVYY